MPTLELQQLRADLAAARAALDDFAYVVSHDLRAQLRHITAYGELLRDELGSQLTGDASQFLNTMTEAAQQMGRQIDGLKTWAQLDTLPLHPMAVDAAVLLAEVRQALAPEAQGRTVQWRIAPDLPRLQGDPVLLRQLFTHLLSNALKFTRPRAIAAIDIDAQAAPGGLVLVRVRDNGVGYNPAQQTKLFHVFQRLHSARQFEGLGLGLALAHKIVQRHGGGLAIEGTPDAGCCVSLTLPLAG